MIRKVQLYFLLLVLVSFISLHAQLLQPPYKNYKSEQGLASSEVYQCLQDTKGFIWLATSNGISKFNGNYFTNFTSENGLPDNTILYIVGEDKDGVIWFLSMGMDLIGISPNHRVIIHPANEELKKHFQTSTNILPSISNDGSFYFNLIVNGKCIVITRDNKIKDAGLLANTGTLLLKKNSSRFLVQTNEQVFNAPFKIKNIKLLDDAKKDINFNISSPFVCSSQPRFIYENNQLVAIVNDVIYVYNKKTTSFDSLNIGARIIDAYVDNNNNLFVSTHLSGLYRIKDCNLSIKSDHFLNNKSIGRMIRDEEGGYWIPSLKDGLFYIRALNNQSVLFKDIDQNYSVEKLARGKNDVLFAVSNGQVYRWFNGGIELVDLKFKKGERKPIFQSLHYDAFYDRFIVSTDNFSAKIVKDGITNQLKNNIGAILSYASSPIGTYCGNWACISAVDPKTLKVISRTIGEFKIRADVLYLHNTDSILVGSTDGLYLYIPSKKSIKTLKEKNVLLGSRIKQIIKFNSYYLLATKKDGIVYFPVNAPELAKKLDVTLGLASNNISAITINDKEIWIATNKGINRFKSIDEILSGKKPKLYTVADGLLTNEIHSIAVLENILFAGSNEGLSIVDLIPFDSSASLRINPKLEIIDFLTDTLLNSSSDSILLPNHYDFFKVNFEGLYFRAPKELTYRYRLQNFEEKWHETKLNSLEYFNLDPGNYILEIMVSTDKGSSWHSSKKYFVQVTPYYYQTWWFRIPLLICALGLIYYFISLLFFRSKLKKLKKIRAQTRLNNVELKALRAQMNPHFIFNVISSIQNYILDNDSKAAYKYLATFSKLIRNVLNNSERKDILIKDEINWLSQYIELEKMRFKERFSFEIVVDENIDRDSTTIPSMILQPLIENSIKHAFKDFNQTGVIKLSFAKIDDALIIVVEDNGVGINSISPNDSENHQSMSSRITQERIQIYNEIYGREKIKINYIDLSEEGLGNRGTRVVLSIK